MAELVALGTQMPALPVTSGIMGKATRKEPTQITAGEAFPAMQEMRGEQQRLRGSIADADTELARMEQEQKVAGLEQKQQLQEMQAQELRQLPERERLRAAREELSSAAFVPTKDNAQDIATIFSLTGLVGMALGGGAKQNAYAAMAAMNGMLDGYQKGRADLYKRERDMFDKNLKSLQTKVQTLQQELTEAIQLKQQDFKAGETAIEIAMTKAGADLLDTKRKRNGDVAALETLNQTAKDVEKLIGMSNDQFKQEEERKFRRDQLAQQERLRRAQMEQTRVLAELKAGSGGGLKMPAKVQEAYVADNQLRVDIASLKNQLRDPELVQQIKQYGVESFLSEEGGKAISQVMQRQMPEKLSKFLTEVRDMRNNYYLTISGKAVTGGEALRNYGVVPQPGDSQQQMLNKLDGMERRVGQKISAMQGLYNVPDISGRMAPGTPTMINPNENYAVSASEQPSSTGGKTIVRQGTVQSGPNAGKRVIEYSDGSKEYK